MAPSDPVASRTHTRDAQCASKAIRMVNSKRMMIMATRHGALNGDDFLHYTGVLQLEVLRPECPVLVAHADSTLARRHEVLRPECPVLVAHADPAWLVLQLVFAILLSPVQNRRRPKMNRRLETSQLQRHPPILLFPHHR